MTEKEIDAFRLGAMMMREIASGLADDDALFCLNVRAANASVPSSGGETMTYAGYYDLAVANHVALAERIYHAPLPVPPLKESPT